MNLDHLAYSFRQYIYIQVNIYKYFHIFASICALTNICVCCTPPLATYKEFFTSEHIHNRMPVITDAITTWRRSTLKRQERPNNNNCTNHKYREYNNRKVTCMQHWQQQQEKHSKNIQVKSLIARKHPLALNYQTNRGAENKTAKAGWSVVWIADWSSLNNWLELIGVGLGKQMVVDGARCCLSYYRAVVGTQPGI